MSKEELFKMVDEANQIAPEDPVGFMRERMGTFVSNNKPTYEQMLADKEREERSNDKRAMLVGGPRDGEMYQIETDTDYLYLEEPEEPSFDFDGDPLASLTTNTPRHTYKRQVLRNDVGDVFYHVFVWQGDPGDPGEQRRRERKAELRLHNAEVAFRSIGRFIDEPILTSDDRVTKVNPNG